MRAIIFAHVAASYLAVLIDITINIGLRGSSAWQFMFLPLSPIAVPIGMLVSVITRTPPSRWLLFSVSYLLVFGLAYRVLSSRYLRQYRIAAGFCSICGYDLRATPDRCPECGTITSGNPPS